MYRPGGTGCSFASDQATRCAIAVRDRLSRLTIKRPYDSVFFAATRPNNHHQLVHTNCENGQSRRVYTPNASQGTSCRCRAGGGVVLTLAPADTANFPARTTTLVCDLQLVDGDDVTTLLPGDDESNFVLVVRPDVTTRTAT